MRSITAFLSGVAVSLLAAYAARGIRRQRRQQVRNLIDLNQCSLEDFKSLGLDSETADRVLENRPYRSKLELVSRVMLPTDIYSSIKDRVGVSNAREPVKVAS